jgi:hypothetical protein
MAAAATKGGSHEKAKTQKGKDLEAVTEAKSDTQHENAASRRLPGLLHNSHSSSFHPTLPISRLDRVEIDDDDIHTRATGSLMDLVDGDGDGDGNDDGVAPTVSSSAAATVSNSTTRPRRRSGDMHALSLKARPSAVSSPPVLTEGTSMTSADDGLSMRVTGGSSIRLFSRCFPLSLSVF